jgi:hypothetical protein
MGRRVFNEEVSMFRIEAFVEDKKLGDALKALAGLCRGQPSVAPVMNVDETSGDGPVKAAGNGNIIHMLASHLRHIHKVRITSKEIAAWLKSQGRSPQSASYTAREACKLRILKKVGGPTSGNYEVVSPKKAAKPKAKSKPKTKAEVTA